MLPPIFGNQGQQKPQLPSMPGTAGKPGVKINAPQMPQRPAGPTAMPKKPLNIPGMNMPATGGPPGLPTGTGPVKPQGTPVANAMQGQAGKNYVPQVLGLIEKLIASGLLAK